MYESEGVVSFVSGVLSDCSVSGVALSGPASCECGVSLAAPCPLSLLIVVLGFVSVLVLSAEQADDAAIAVARTTPGMGLRRLATRAEEQKGHKPVLKLAGLTKVLHFGQRTRAINGMLPRQRLDSSGF